MPARLTAYPPDGAALVRVIEEGTTYRVGRASMCELRIEHASVSRFHAELEWRGEAWLLSDTGSKNGLRVNGHMVRSAELDASTWFSIGDVQCSFERIDDAAASAHRSVGLSRREVSRALSAQLQQPDVGMSTLIPQMLDMVLQLSGLDRGFVLYADAGQPLRVHASRALRKADFSGDRFAGSASAVERTLATRKSVVCCDTSDSPWLAQRPSVRLGGIRAVVCVPLQARQQAFGVLYADSRRPGPAITELDLELIEAVAGHVAAALAARQLRGEVAELLRAAANAGLQAPRWDELRSRVPRGEEA